MLKNVRSKRHAAIVLGGMFVAFLTPLGSAVAADNASTRSAVAPEVSTLAKERGVSNSEANARVGRQDTIARNEASLRARFSNLLGGWWFDLQDADRLKVAVLSSAPAGERTALLRRLNELGLEGHYDVVEVKRLERELEALRDRLAADVERAEAETPAVPIAVGVDSSLNQVAVLAPEESDRTPAQQSFIDGVESDEAVRVVVEPVKSTDLGCVAVSGAGLGCDPPLRGAQLWNTDSFFNGCSFGFFVRSKTDSKPFFLTSGHCFTGSEMVYAFNGNSDRISVGLVHRYMDGDLGDHAIVNITNSYWPPKPFVYVYSSSDTVADATYYITNDARASAGQRMCVSGGRSTQTKCGNVNSVPEVVVSQQTLLRVDNVCGLVVGDSGSPVFASHTAYGVVKSYESAGSRTPDIEIG